METFTSKALLVTPSTRLPGLDGLRAISAMLVIAAHASHRVEATIPPWLFHVCARGGFGVDIFFVISGFIITHTLLREEDATGAISLKWFYIRRAFRILPPAFAYLAIIGLLTVSGIIPGSFSAIITAALFVRNLFGFSDWYTSHFWSLAIEEQFYLLWPFLLVLVARTVRLRLLIALWLFAPIWKAGNFLILGGHNVNQMRFDFRYDGLLAGAILAILWASPDMRRRLIQSCQSKGSLVAVTLLIAIGTLALESHDPRWAIPFSPLRALCVAVWIIALISNRAGFVGSLFNWSPIAWMGAASYSLYLWQQLTVGNLPGASITQITTGIALAILCAAVSFYAIEQPMLQMRKRIEFTTR